MSLDRGTRLGPYEIQSLLGAGGMGEVYRGRDLRLNRTIAIKVLPAAFAADSVRRERFESEARAASALNHPNIIVVHDVGEASGVCFIVSELVDGESLRSMVQRGPVPTRKLLDIAVQIAHGLAAAHAAGIVHRDLKPENIMVTRLGKVKILDFGLARQAPAAILSGADEIETITRKTEPGVVMGTVGYMAPEQLRGKLADARSDLFSFGAVLYEMLSGKRAFRGESTIDVMTAILKEDVAELPAAAPPNLDRVVRRCLEKNPDQRFQSAADLAFALESLTSPSSNAASLAPPAAAPLPVRQRVLRAGTLLVLMAALIGAFLLYRGPASPPSFQRLTFRQGSLGTARFSPDGQNVVYGATWDGSPAGVYVSRVGSPEMRRIELPEGSILLSVSSTGELAVRLGRGSLHRTGLLARVPLSGGQPRELLEDVLDADWLPDGASLAVMRLVGLKYRIEFPIGHVVHELNWPTYWIRVSPDGQRVVFVDMEKPPFTLTTIDRTGRKQVLTSVAGAQIQPSALAWSPDGKEVWYSTFDRGETGVVYAVNLQGKRRLLARLPGRGILQDVSRDGKGLIDIGSRRWGIMCLAPGENVERDLSWLDGSKPEDLSSDGKRILFTEVSEGGGPHNGVYLRGTDGSPAIRLGEGQGGSISPDGKWVDVLRVSPTPKYFFVPTGAGEERPLVVPDMEELGAIAWLPDGKRFLVYGRYPGKQRRFFVWDPAAATVRAVTPERAFESQVDILPNPDGTQFPAQDADGKWYLYPVEKGQTRLIPGLDPSERPLAWSTDGRSLYVTTKIPGPSFAVYRLDPGSGRKTLWKEIKPDKPVAFIMNLLMTRDGRSYAYGYERTISDLYLVTGLN